MDLYSIFIIALALAMDAFAVSITNGMSTYNYRWYHGIKIGLFFGVFQFAMTVAGFFLGSTFKQAITQIDHFVAFILLLFIGGKSIIEAVKNKDEKVCKGESKNTLSFSVLTVQGVATSIDALAVGVSMAVIKEINIWSAASVIGAVAFILPFFGGLMGKIAGKWLGRFAELAGGIILVGIGVKILLEHLLGKA